LNTRSVWLFRSRWVAAGHSAPPNWSSLTLCQLLACIASSRVELVAVRGRARCEQGRRLDAVGTAFSVSCMVILLRRLTLARPCGRNATFAEGMKDEVPKQMMLRIAQDYEKLARWAAERSKGIAQSKSLREGFRSAGARFVPGRSNL
jgi:hypothetical protein